MSKNHLLFTMRDIFGCRSGLPYICINYREYIQELQPTLYNVYLICYLLENGQEYDMLYKFSSLTFIDACVGNGCKGTATFNNSYQGGHNLVLI